MSTEAVQRSTAVSEGSPDISAGGESSLKLPVKKRVVSGVQPTGNLHLGNYLGAIKQWAANQVKAEQFLVGDNVGSVMHAWTPSVLRP